MDFLKFHDRSNFRISWWQKIDVSYYQKCSPIKNTLISRDTVSKVIGSSRYSSSFSIYYAVIQFHSLQTTSILIAEGKVIDYIVVKLFVIIFLFFWATYEILIVFLSGWTLMPLINNSIFCYMNYKNIILLHKNQMFLFEGVYYLLSILVCFSLSLIFLRIVTGVEKRASILQNIFG